MVRIDERGTKIVHVSVLLTHPFYFSFYHFEIYMGFSKKDLKWIQKTSHLGHIKVCLSSSRRGQLFFISCIRETNNWSGEVNKLLLLQYFLIGLLLVLYRRRVRSWQVIYESFYLVEKSCDFSFRLLIDIVLRIKFNEHSYQQKCKRFTWNCLQKMVFCSIWRKTVGISWYSSIGL